MALLGRDRRVSRSEYTRDYYRPSSSITAPSLTPQEQPYAPPVPPRRPGQVSLPINSCIRAGGSNAWVLPPPINPSIWRASHSAKLHDSHAHASHAQRTRAENRRLCDETERLTVNHKSEVERRLADRVCDITFWREELAARHTAMDQDSTNLNTLKDRLNKAHDLYMRPLQVAYQCIEIRRGRVGVEGVEDEALTALRQEVKEVTRCREALERTSADTAHQIRRVLSCRYHLEKNLLDKDTALRVEEATTNLTPTAPPTAIIPKQTIDPSPISVEWWCEVGVKLLKRSDDEHQLSEQITALAEDILVATARHLRERLEHTDHCLKERILDTRHAKTLLEEQHAKLVEEESQLEQSLVEVEDQLEAKRGPLALAQTRLHTRTLRPNIERTRDEVEAALLKEVEELELTISRLTSAAEHTRNHLQQLRSTRVSLQHDINLKAKTLLLDEVKVMALRDTVTIDTH